jgi:hypothetical protein
MAERTGRRRSAGAPGIVDLICFDTDLGTQARLGWAEASEVGSNL